MKKKLESQTQSESSLEKNYKPGIIEQFLYSFWEKNGYFKPNGNCSNKSFCIVIPPPNVTGSLHMGHAFQQTIMDILIRYQRMQGKNTLWQSGTDHAGIATQLVVEHKLMATENKTRHDYGRESFIKKIWQWKEESRGNIAQQMRRLGNSVDWQRDRFTMDADISKAVTEAFVQLYQDNLIYRGKRLVNWDPKLHTAISDLEVNNREANGFMWYLRYPLADGAKTVEGKDYLIVATTRPETMLGDTAVAVNPDDLRYNNLIGKKLLLPLVHRLIPIIGDKHADIKKGTGCVKITPAHDFNDYIVGKRHQLPMINLFDLNGHMHQYAEVFDSKGNATSIVHAEIIPTRYQGMERFVARKAIVSDLDKLGLLECRKPHQLTLPYSDRSGVIIEPMLTDQWYVRTFQLAEQAIAAVKDGCIQFVPKKYENMYFAWMRDVQDWCISRQLWWGHRIPAWYDDLGHVYVGYDEDVIRIDNHLSVDIILYQDEDVLDTWFCSSLWTFATLGWPENSEELKTFHPTDVLVSGFDIIFFWIARMIMLTMHFIKTTNGQAQIPFKTVYMTGLVRDEEGNKMSKSQGNVIDPIDMIDGISLEDLLKKRTSNMMQPKLAAKIERRTRKEYPNGIKAHGADAVRFTLAALASTGRDIHWDMKRLAGYRNFCNKLWQASRYVLMHTEGKDCGQNSDEIIFSRAERWIIAEFNQTVKLYREALDTYRFDIAAKSLYEFIWNQFCDWYLELSKLVIQTGSATEIRATRYTLIEILENLLCLAHPIIPFITEAIWQRVKIVKGIQQDTIMLQSFPIFEETKVDEEIRYDLEWIKEIIIAIRNIRAEMNILPNQPLDILLRIATNKRKQCVIENINLIKLMARLSSLTILDNLQFKPLSINKWITDAEVLIPMTCVVDKNFALARIHKEQNKLRNEITVIEKKLSNDRFVNRAPAYVIEKERERLAAYLAKQQKLMHQQEMMCAL